MNMKKFIKQLEREKKRGNNNSHIRDKLLAKGFPQDIIDDALEMDYPVIKSSQVKIVLIWIFVCAALIVFLYYGIINFN
ncbi:hypothetical protein JXM83_06200 [Candidatus Woesearchaeota archaeon]|nr:hypothetical protein [Candidatus Woesearchaeota archaeon]